MAYIVCTRNLDLVSFRFVPALYSTLKLEIFQFTRIIIGIVEKEQGTRLDIGVCLFAIYTVTEDVL